MQLRVRAPAAAMRVQPDRYPVVPIGKPQRSRLVGFGGVAGPTYSGQLVDQLRKCREAYAAERRWGDDCARKFALLKDRCRRGRHPCPPPAPCPPCPPPLRGPRKLPRSRKTPRLPSPQRSQPREIPPPRPTPPPRERMESPPIDDGAWRRELEKAREEAGRGMPAGETPPPIPPDAIRPSPPATWSPPPLRERPRGGYTSSQEEQLAELERIYGPARDWWKRGRPVPQTTTERRRPSGHVVGPSPAAVLQERREAALRPQRLPVSRSAIPRPSVPPVRNRRLVAPVREAPRAQRETMPIPASRSRIDPTPARPNAWGFVGTGKMEKRRVPR